MKRAPQSILVFVILFLALIGLSQVKPVKKPVLSFSSNQRFHQSGFFEYKNIILGSLEIAKEEYQEEFPDRTQIGITSHHLPTAAPLIAKFYTALLKNPGPRDVFVIIGPDHYEKAQELISTTDLPFITPFGQLGGDMDIIRDLERAGIDIDRNVFGREHSIGVQTVFIKALFPEAKIVPLILSANAPEGLIKEVVEVLKDYEERIILIGSVDFSHELCFEDAQVVDKESKEMLLALSFAEFDVEHVDSPPTIKLLGMFARIVGSEDIKILDVENSFHFDGNEHLTTGYINAMFLNPGEGLKLMFVGDVMLSRVVGERMEKENDWRWPFLEIADYLKKADLLFGNLEGPISERGRESESTFTFRASPKAAQGLRYAGFDVLSIANNHMMDFSETAFEDTLDILKENNIGYVGGGLDKEEAYKPVIKEINGIKIAFLAYTDVGEAQSGIAWLNEDNLVTGIKEAKRRGDVVIVSFHSGDEYSKEPSKKQKYFSHLSIDKGADLIIGHHPHVIQPIEEYKDRYIAYSLGNFIFDQTFSEDTRKGLILEVLLNQNKEIESVDSVNIRINDDFQPEVIK